MESCRPLGKYSIFMKSVRDYERRLHDMDLTMRMAIGDLPDDSVIKPFLVAHMAEVKIMCLTEYDEKYEREFLIKESKAEGRAEGAERMGSLMLRLKSLGRVDDAFRAVSDPIFREELFKEFNL